MIAATRRAGLIASWLIAATVAHAEAPPTPAESLAALKLADPALRIELVASEPDVAAPVAIAWDEHRRLYVVEMTDYPTADTGGRVKRLEDRDGDGRYERVTVFAEGLKFPSGVLPWDGGVLVTAAPDLLFFKDTDGDGKADVRTVILTGFAEGNQQLRVNSPTWGIDNRVYLANGRSGGTVRRPADPPEKAVAIPRNDLRLDPAIGRFEPVAGFSQFGLPRDDWGDRFPSWNTVPLRHVVLEERRDAAASDTPTVAEILDLADGGRIYSLAPTQRRFNAETVTYFNATCGPTIFRGSLLGDPYRGDAFVCEPLTSVVHHRRLEPAGPTFVARRAEVGREFLASTHPWFRPVNLAGGPDGALYVVDFCRAWVEHPAFVPEGQRHAVDFREGHDRGRIWRISRRDAAPKSPPSRPGEAATDALVALLGSPEGWCRDTAQRLIVERQDKGAVDPLRALVRESQDPRARVHALATLDGLSSLDLDTLRHAIRDADPRVRERAVRLAEPRAAEVAADLVARADDADERVRLRAALSLGPLDQADARTALAKIAARDAASPWTAAAILQGLGDQPSRFLADLTARGPGWRDQPTTAQAQFLSRLTALIGQRNQPAEVAAVVEEITRAPGDGAAFAMLQGLAQGQARVKPARLDWASPDPRLDRVRAAAVDAARAAGRPGWLRVLALDVAISTSPREALTLILPLLDPAQPTELQWAAARGLARLNEPTTAGKVLESWDRLALTTRRALLGSLATTAPLASRLIDAIESGTVAVAEIDPTTSDALRRVGDPALHARAEAVLRARPADDRREVVRNLEPALDLKPDPARGRDLFVRHCQTCHARNGRGAKVGPDLISVAGRPRADLLVAILDPSREVAPDGLGVVVLTTDGRTLSGLLAEETPAAIRLRRAEGVEDLIPRGEVEALRPTGRSLMPDGLEQVLRPQDLADLIDYLRSPEPAAP